MRLIPISLLLLFLYTGMTTAFGQDSDCEGISSFFVGSIIPNPSFEEQDDCPTKASQLDYAVDWKQATWATTDYFTEGCYMGQGFIVPPTPFPDGKSCVGIITEGLEEKNNKYQINQEYVGTNLKSDLEQGTEYTLSFYVGFGTPTDPQVDPEDEDEIYTGVVTPEKTTLSLYAYDQVAYFPLKTRRSIELDYPEWELIGETVVENKNGTGWVLTDIKFTPDKNYKAIILGGIARDIKDVTDINNQPREYVFIDNLILNKTDEFEFGEPIKVGSICNGDLKLVAPEVAHNMVVSYQWYKDGQELNNEFSSEILLGDAVGKSGEYYVIITDGKECVQSDPIYVDENDDYNMKPAGSLCKGGSLTLDAGSGYDDYTWNTGETTQVITISDIGNYSVTVTKSNGCTGSDTVSIMNATEILLSADVFDADYGESNGAINLSVSGGAFPYTFKWSNGAETKNIDNLAGGSYTVEVWDDNGCYATMSFDVNEVPKKLNVNISVTPVLCYGDKTGAISIEVKGGVPPYEIIWPDLEVTGNEITDLPAGQYQFIVKDNQNKMHKGAATVTEPDALRVSSSYVKSPTCFDASDGEFKVIVEGGEPPYDIEWSHSTSSSLEFKNMEAGTYKLTVTDMNGCMTTTEVGLIAPDKMEATFISEDPSCYGIEDGYVRLGGLAGGHRPYSYFLNGNQVDLSQLQNLTEGTYLVEVVDDNGCTISHEFTLTEPDLIEVSLSTDNSHIIEGDSTTIYLDVFPEMPENFNYSWSTSISNNNSGLCDSCAENIVSPRHTTQYTFTLTNGLCSYSDAVTINVEAIRIYMPNAFTPNDDGINDKLIIGTNGKNLTVVSFDVFNRWGNLVYSEKNVPLQDFKGWDGLHKNQLAAPGTYMYKVDLMDNKGKHFKRKSTITILN